ncbi:transposase [Rhodoferax lacus]|uniref:transposase n=1 Tax=Rhodoferax lacus TaxID=2184758 RepID=UPI003B836350
MREIGQDRVPNVAKRHLVSDGTIYVFRKKFGQLDIEEVKRLKEPEAENAHLKKIQVEDAHVNK